MERKLTAILCADVYGYSRLMGEDEEATLRTLSAHRKIIDGLIEQHRGRFVNSAGDSVLAEFVSVVNAVQCAVEIQTTLKAENANLPPDRRMDFRIGINLGDVMVDGEQIYGDGVNVAARLESVAEPGGICISGAVHDQVGNKLAVGYDDLGEQTVKNIAKAVRVFRIRTEARDAALTARELDVTGGAPSSAISDKPSIVVLPFTNMSGDPAQEYFSDGITEDLTSDLSKLSGLLVIARTSAFAYKTKAVKIQEVSRELGVHYVLEGSVRKTDSRVRITAQLVDATTGYHLWAERYDRSLTDLFALQDEVGRKIVLALKVMLTREERERFKSAPTDNLEAYDRYLQGLQYLFRTTKEANLQARQWFEKATELDPQYAAAYVGLGWTYDLEWFLVWTRDPQTLERALAQAERAVILDDSLPGAHTLLAHVVMHKGQHERAVSEAERAIILSPNYANGYSILAEILTFAGQPEETFGLVEQARRLNPQGSANYSFQEGHAYRLMGRYEEALTAFKTSLIRMPNHPSAHRHLAVVYVELGREAEARAEAAEVLRCSPEFSLEDFGHRIPYKDPMLAERYVAGLRKAGLK